jgi:hypothetical protein
MTKLDLVIVLAAAILGTFGAQMTVAKIAVQVGWLVLAVWAVLKLANIL